MLDKRKKKIRFLGAPLLASSDEASSLEIKGRPDPKSLGNQFRKQNRFVVGIDSINRRSIDNRKKY